MVSGPTNSRSSGTVGNDRGRPTFGSKHWKNRCIGLESADKRWSLTIAEDLGQPNISGVTLGVTQSGELELPPTERDSSLACAKTKGLLGPASLSTALIRFRMPNSNWQIASLVSSGELAIEGSCGRYRPQPVNGSPAVCAAKRTLAP
jgi:hypothetical protein